MLKGGVNMVITLDAGHYGKYNQSPVIKEFYESEFNWKLTNRLAQYLRHYGITVRLTRSNINRDLSLFNRGFSAKGSDMFISIHANACNNSNVDYPVVIRGYNEHETDKLALELALSIGKILNTRQFGRTYTRKNKNNEYYGVLRGAKSAGVKYRFIIEHSFYTNRKACYSLLDNDIIDQLANKEAEIIAKYFGIKSKGTQYVKVLENHLNIRSVADWKATPCGTVNKGEVFTVIRKVKAKNGDVEMYELKSGAFITSHPKYVDTFYK